jgi:asparagine synthase (glutamine-hydrolysing)
VIIPGITGHIAIEAPAGDFLARARATLHAPDSAATSVSAVGMMAWAASGWVASEQGVTCAVAGNLDWLQVDLAAAQINSDPARAVLNAYRLHGIRLLDRLGGRFALALWDSTQKTGMLARDRFGQMPLFWAEAEDGGLVFSPTADSIDPLLQRSSTLSDQAILNYFYFHMVPSPIAVFEGVNKLLAGHMLIGENGEWRTLRYWSPDFREHSDTSMTEARDQMMGLLSSSVYRLTRQSDVGAFLSGGLDSSTVAGILAKHRPKPPTYSIGFDAEGYDEIAFARIASERFNTVFNTYYVTPEDVLNELPRIAAAYDEPFGNSSALPAFFCARMAVEDGRQRLLAGDGGDELFAGNERYAKQGVFERYALLPRWTRKGLLEPLLAALPERPAKIAKARSYVQQANVPLPDRLQTYNFLNRLGVANIISDDFLQSVDVELPLQLDRDLYNEPRAAGRLNRMLYLDWHHTLADNDLRKVNRMCELANIEVEYPMLDDHVVEFSTRVSSSRKMRNGRLRDFYKRAVVDFLPREIIDKTKHGFGLPFGVWMEQHPGLQELASDNLARMKRRRYIRPAFIDEIQRLHREQHAGYYGEFIWSAVMLELWLTAHGIEP